MFLWHLWFFKGQVAFVSLAIGSGNSVCYNSFAVGSQARLLGHKQTLVGQILHAVWLYYWHWQTNDAYTQYISDTNWCYHSFMHIYRKHLISRVLYFAETGKSWFYEFSRFFLILRTGVWALFPDVLNLIIVVFNLANGHRLPKYAKLNPLWNIRRILW